MELPIKGKDIKGIDSDGNVRYVFRCNCKSDKCTEWRCSITGCALIVHIVEWEYIE